MLHDNPEEMRTHFLSNREKQFVFPNFKPGKGCGLTVSCSVISITIFLSKTLDWMVNGWLIRISSLIKKKNLGGHFTVTLCLGGSPFPNYLGSILFLLQLQENGVLKVSVLSVHYLHLPHMSLKMQMIHQSYLICMLMPLLPSVCPVV